MKPADYIAKAGFRLKVDDYRSFVQGTGVNSGWKVEQRMDCFMKLSKGPAVVIVVTKDGPFSEVFAHVIGDGQDVTVLACNEAASTELGLPEVGEQSGMKHLKPLTLREIADHFRKEVRDLGHKPDTPFKPTDLDWFRAGVRWAEEQHGIGAQP